MGMISGGYEVDVLLMQKEARDITDNCIKHYRKDLLVMIKDEILLEARNGKSQIVIGDDFIGGFREHLAKYQPGVFRDILLEAFPGMRINIKEIDVIVGQIKNYNSIRKDIRTTITISW